MGVKLQFGKQPCPWRPATEVPYVPVGNMFVLMLLDGNDMSSNVVSGSLDISPVLHYGKQVGDPEEPKVWQEQLDPKEAYAPSPVLAWHLPDVPVDVGKLDRILDFMEDSMEWDACEQWYQQFAALWKNEPWKQNAPVNQYGEKIGYGDPIASGLQGDTGLAGVFEKSKATPISGSPSEFIVPHSSPKAKSAIKGFFDYTTLPGGKAIPFSPHKVGLAVNVDVTGKPELQDAPAPKKFMGMDVHVDPAMGDDMMVMHTVGGPPQAVKLQDDPVELIKKWEKAGKLPMMKWPDGKMRSVLLAWHLLEGPGNMFAPDALMLTSEILVGNGEKDLKSTVVTRQALQKAWETHAKQTDIPLPHLLMMHQSLPLLPTQVDSIRQLAFEIGIPAHAYVMVIEVHDEWDPQHYKKVKVGFSLWLSPGSPMYIVEKKMIL
jgi:hypothetical protein